MGANWSSPEISICLPTYNGSKYIESSLDSILRQSYDNFELIVCDDASSDNTLEIVRSISDPRLLVFRNERRLGLVDNWNRCLSYRRGRYVVLMHQDDRMHPDNLALKLRFLEAHPHVALVHSDIRRIDQDGHVMGGHWLPQGDQDRLETGTECLRRLLSEGNFICCPSVMMRSEALAEVGEFDSRLPYTTDYEMWLRFAGRYDVGYLAQPLVDYRVHMEQETTRFCGGREVLETARAAWIALYEHLSHPSRQELWQVARRALMRWALRLAYWEARRGRVYRSLKYFSAAAHIFLESRAITGGFDINRL